MSEEIKTADDLLDRFKRETGYWPTARSAPMEMGDPYSGHEKERIVNDLFLTWRSRVRLEAEVAELKRDAVWLFRLIDKEAFHGPECTCSEDDMPCPVNVYYDMKERWLRARATGGLMADLSVEFVLRGEMIERQKETIARLEAEVAEWRSCSRIGTEKAQALAAEVAELKALALALVAYMPDGLDLSPRQRGLLEE